MVDAASKLDENNLIALHSAGFSRVPVFSSSRHHVRGLLLVKRLILLDPSRCSDITPFALRQPQIVSPLTPLIELLQTFLGSSAHFALVSWQDKEYTSALASGAPIPNTCFLLGCVTMEDGAIASVCTHDGWANRVVLSVCVLMFDGTPRAWSGCCDVRDVCCSAGAVAVRAHL